MLRDLHGASLQLALPNAIVVSGISVLGIRGALELGFGAVVSV